MRKLYEQTSLHENHTISFDSFCDGVNIVGAHIDAPRLDLKPTPLYEDSELAYFKTHYYGGIKKYQWLTTPMALHGVVVRKDGSVENIVIGEDENDPVVGISDLLVHLSGDQLQKNAARVIEGEDLDVTNELNNEATVNNQQQMIIDFEAEMMKLLDPISDSYRKESSTNSNTQQNNQNTIPIASYLYDGIVVFQR